MQISEKLRIGHFLFESAPTSPITTNVYDWRSCLRQRNPGGRAEQSFVRHSHGGDSIQKERGVRACVPLCVVCVLLRPHEFDSRASVAVRNKNLRMEPVKDGQQTTGAITWSSMLQSRSIPTAVACERGESGLLLVA